MNQFSLKGTEKGFGYCVVGATARGAHALHAASTRCQPLKALAAILRSAVCMKNPSPVTALPD